MVDIKNLFVPLEMAKSLEELGFKEPCLAFYAKYPIDNDIKEGQLVFVNQGSSYYGTDSYLETVNTTSKNSAYQIFAPTYQQAFKWLRDEYNIDAWVQPFMDVNRNGVEYLPDESYSYYIFRDGSLSEDGIDYLNFESAQTECLYKAINLLR